MQQVGSYKYIYLNAKDDNRVLHFVYDYVSYLQGPFESLNLPSYENCYTLE